MTIYESIKKSIAFIEDNLENNIGVLDVSNSVSYSQFYFSREFSRYTHISIYDYIIRRKISESYKYLFQSDPKIIDLAYRFGFQSHEVYTRAFRKIFGENPSEAKVYKPFVIFEAIDDNYLLFLKNLKTEILNETVMEWIFEVSSISDLNHDGPLLLLLPKEHRLSCNCILKGNLINEDTTNLSFKLKNLRHKIRIHDRDTTHSLRYFLNNIYDSNELGSNSILITKSNQYIDFYVSAKDEY